MARSGSLWGKVERGGHPPLGLDPVLVSTGAACGRRAGGLVYPRPPVSWRRAPGLGLPRHNLVLRDGCRRGHHAVVCVARSAAHLAPVDAGTLHRPLSRVARQFGLSAEHQAKLAARGYEVADCGPEARQVFASLPADRAARVAVASSLLSDAYTRTTEAERHGHPRVCAPEPRPALGRGLPTSRDRQRARASSRATSKGGSSAFSTHPMRPGSSTRASP
jgi:hypothetical protein